MRTGKVKGCFLILGGLVFVAIVLFLATGYVGNAWKAAADHRRLEAAYPNEAPKALALNQVGFIWSTGGGWRGGATFDLDTRELRGGAGNGISSLLIAPLKDKDGKTVAPPRITDAQMETIRRCLSELQPSPHELLGQPQGEFDIAFWRDGNLQFYRYFKGEIPEPLLGLGKCIGVLGWMDQP